MGKLKEINAKANYAWSPSNVENVYIAAGTASQQIDTNFNSASKLEIFSVDFQTDELVAPCVGRIDTQDRYRKVVWGTNPGGMGNLICGTEKGEIHVYDPTHIMNSGDQNVAPMWVSQQHLGPVRALDVNPITNHYLVSGSNDSEITVWDINKPPAPISPGKRTTPLAPITALAWNKQVQHILASTSATNTGPNCFVWDLKQMKVVIAIADPKGMMDLSSIAWHPTYPTQLVISSQNDNHPVVQLWDLKYASQPIQTYDKHMKGVTSLSWCPQDQDLLASSSKTNEIFVWNPNTNPVETLFTLETSTHYNSDIQWSPRDPTLLSSGSFEMDGQISVFSCTNGGFHAEQAANDKQQNALAESFGAGFTISPSPHQIPANQQQNEKKIVGKPLSKAPSWMRKPCGASFGFGGRLISFGVEKPATAEQKAKSAVKISQVVTEECLLKRAKELQEALVDNNNCQKYCSNKVETSQNELETDVWNFLLVNFEAEPRSKYLELLGYKAEDLKLKFKAHLENAAKQPIVEPVAEETPIVEETPAEQEEPVEEPPTEGEVPSDEKEPSVESEPFVPDDIEEEPIDEDQPMGEEMQINQPIGEEIAAEVQLEGSSEPFVTGEITSGETGMFGGITADETAAAGMFGAPSEGEVDIFAQVTQPPVEPIVEPARVETPIVEAQPIVAEEPLVAEPLVSEPAAVVDETINIPLIEGDLHSMISQSLLVGDFEHAVDLCISGNLMSEAIIISKSGGEDLYKKTQQFYFDNNKSDFTRLLSAVVTKNWHDLVHNCNVDNWKEAFASILTFADDKELRSLADALGERLEKSPSLKKNSLLLYICSGNIQNICRVWSELSTEGVVKSAKDDAAEQDFVEILMILLHITRAPSCGEITADKLSKYAGMLADQGQFEIALQILPKVDQETIALLRERLGHHQTSSVASSNQGPAQEVAPQQQPEVVPSNQPEPAVAKQNPYKSTRRVNQQQQRFNNYNQQPMQPAFQPSYNGNHGNQYQQPGYAQPTSAYNPVPTPTFQPTPQPAAYQPTPTLQPASTYQQPAVFTPSTAANLQQTPAYPSSAANLQQTPAYVPPTSQPALVPTPQQPAQPEMQLPPQGGSKKSTAGWNDPPPMNLNRPRKKKTAAPKQMPSNIMQPTLQPAVATQPLSNNNFRGNHFQPNNMRPHGNFAPPQQPQMVANQFNPQQPQQMVANGNQGGDNSNNLMQKVPAATGPSVITGALQKEKQPIPDEHKILAESFNGLIKKCQEKSTNPQHRRKLDDCTRKIEFLYDKLRNKSLSPQVASGLHQVVEMIDQRDYKSAIGRHAVVVQKSNFNEITSFMPTVKTLLQIANQLKI